MRLYELFMGPLEQVKPWQMSGLEGIWRFLVRVWRIAIDEQSSCVHSRIQECEDSAEVLKKLHQTIKKVEEDTLALRFNTAISQMMELSHVLYGAEKISKTTLLLFLKTLCPYAPHLCEEIYAKVFAEKDLLSLAQWPKFEAHLAEESSANIVIQINGKKRGELVVEKSLPKEEYENLARQDESAMKYLEDVELVKVIIVQHRLVNFVVKPK
jgi:leucyl-tRNA synthetase